MFKKLLLDNGMPLYINSADYETVRIETKIYSPLNLNPVAASLVVMLANDGNKNYKTKRELTIALEEQYGADLIAKVDKNGESHVATIGVETIPYALIPGDQDPLTKSIGILASTLKTMPFSQKYLEIEKANVIRALKSMKDDKDYLAEQRMLKHIFKDSSFSKSEYGVEEEIEKITLDDLIDFHKKVYVASNMAVYVCGAVTEARIKDELNKALSDIEKGEKLERNLFTPEVPFAENIKKEVIEEEDLEQARMYVAFKVKGIKNMKFSERMALSVLASIYSDKLSNYVREEKDLAYSIYAYTHFSLGTLFATCGFKAKNYDQVKQGIEKITREALEDGNITRQMVEEAKAVRCNIAEGYWFDDQESRIDIAEVYEGRGELNNLGEYLDVIQKITYDSVKNIRKHIDLDNKIIYTLVPKKQSSTGTGLVSFHKSKLKDPRMWV